MGSRASALMCAALAACGGTVAPVPDAALPETFAHQYARALCDNLGGCCAANSLRHDPRACLPVVEAEMQESVVEARIRGLDFHEDLVEGCLRAIATFARTCTQDGDVFRPHWVPECGRIFSSSAPLGATCESDLQCASARCGSSGTCVSLVPEEGQPCPIDWDCSAFPLTLRCNPASHTCAPLVPAGGRCDPGWHAACVAEAYCSYNTDRCTPRAGVGANCATEYYYPYGSACVVDAWCDPSSSTCQPLRQVGEPCTGYEQCAQHVCDGDPATCRTSHLAESEYCGGGK